MRPIPAKNDIPYKPTGHSVLITALRRFILLIGHTSGMRYGGGKITTSNMKLNPQDLKKIADLTLEHYNRNAEDFHAGTQDHDVSQNIAALLQYGERVAQY